MANLKQNHRSEGQKSLKKDTNKVIEKRRDSNDAKRLQKYGRQINQRRKKRLTIVSCAKKALLLFIKRRLMPRGRGVFHQAFSLLFHRYEKHTHALGTYSQVVRSQNIVHTYALPEALLPLRLKSVPQKVYGGLDLT
jgi:hypothetical protein